MNTHEEETPKFDDLRLHLTEEAAAQAENERILLAQRQRARELFLQLSEEERPAGVNYYIVVINNAVPYERNPQGMIYGSQGKIDEEAEYFTGYSVEDTMRRQEEYRRDVAQLNESEREGTYSVTVLHHGSIHDPSQESQYPEEIPDHSIIVRAMTGSLFNPDMKALGTVLIRPEFDEAQTMFQLGWLKGKIDTFAKAQPVT